MAYSKEERQAYDRAYRAKNGAKKVAQARDWRHRNAQHMLDWWRDYYQKNRERILERRKRGNAGKPELTAERLRELLSYDPTTGQWTWLVTRGSTAPAGSIAGTIYSNGYRYITIDYRRYFSSRLAFLYMTGEWPQHEVDHIDRCSSNDKWDNLRPATRSENNANLRSNVVIEFNGKKQHQAAWARELGLSENVIRERRKRGLPPEQLLAA
jgi:HNH endonuclease